MTEQERAKLKAEMKQEIMEELMVKRDNRLVKPQNKISETVLNEMDELGLDAHDSYAIKGAIYMVIRQAMKKNRMSDMFIEDVPKAIEIGKKVIQIIKDERKARDENGTGSVQR